MPCASKSRVGLLCPPQDDTSVLLSRLAVAGVDAVNVRVPGSYLITYDLTDTQGFTARQVTRVVDVRERAISAVVGLTFCGNIAAC